MKQSFWKILILLLILCVAAVSLAACNEQDAADGTASSAELQELKDALAQAQAELAALKESNAQLQSDVENAKTDQQLVFALKDDDTYELVGAADSLLQATVPSSYRGKPVTSIAEDTFRDIQTLRKVMISEGVTSIGARAFYGCAKLGSVTLPNSVTSIGEYAFQNCGQLVGITIPNSVKSIGERAFQNCSALTAVYITDLTAWCGISFGDFANPLWYAHNLYLNDELVTDLVIPEGVTSIAPHMFRNCSALTAITIPDSVTSIGEYAFSYCSALASITIPDSVTSIGNYAFYDCSALTSVTIPNSVTSIGEYAFRNCSALTSVTIGNGVTSIGDYAFSGCYKLVEVYNRSSLNITEGSIGNGYVGYYAKNIFSDPANSKLSTDENGYLIYTDGSVKSLMGYTGTKTALTLPSGVTEIYQYAFYGCSALTSVTIPDSVTSVGKYAFSDCSALTAVYITDLAAWCGISFGSGTANPLWYAHNLYLNDELVTNLVIPDSVTNIGNSAFYNCALTSVTIPNSVTSIEYGAFSYCSALTSVTIPASVTSIGAYAFYGCRALTDVTFANTTGWYRTQTQNAASGIDITVTDAAENASNLRSTYSGYYWYRK